MDGTLTDTTTLGQSGPGSNGNERVLHIPWSLSLRCSLVSNPGHLLRWRSYLSVEMQLAYFTSPSSRLGWFPIKSSKHLFKYSKQSRVTKQNIHEQFFSLLLCPWYYAKLYSMLRLQFWSSVEYGFTSLLPLLPSPLWLGVGVPNMAPFHNPYNCMQTWLNRNSNLKPYYYLQIISIGNTWNHIMVAILFFIKNINLEL